MSLSKIVLVSESASIAVELDSGSVLLALLEKQLPLGGCLRLWGKEAYIDNIRGLDNVSLDGAVDWVEKGTVALWPDGRAISLFFGSTPVGIDERIKTAGLVLPIGRIIDEDINSFAGLKDGKTVEIRVQEE